MCPLCSAWSHRPRIDPVFLPAAAAPRPGGGADTLLGRVTSDAPPPPTPPPFLLPIGRRAGAESAGCFRALVTVWPAAVHTAACRARMLCFRRAGRRRSIRCLTQFDAYQGRRTADRRSSFNPLSRYIGRRSTRCPSRYSGRLAGIQSTVCHGITSQRLIVRCQG